MYHIKENILTLRDSWELFNEKSLNAHLDNSYRVLTRRLEEIKESTRQISAEQQKELVFMVEEFVSANNISHELEK